MIPLCPLNTGVLGRYLKLDQGADKVLATYVWIDASCRMLGKTRSCPSIR